MLSMHGDLTTEEYRSYLRVAWFDAQQSKQPLYNVIMSELRRAQRAVGGGMTLQSSASNGKMATVAQGGTMSAPPNRFVVMWENLLSRDGWPVGIGFLPTQKLLTFCALYDLNPDCPEQWPDPLPAPVASPPPVTDAQIYTFMDKNLWPITSRRSDYGWLRISSGHQYA